MPDISYEYYYTVFCCGNEGIIPSGDFPFYCRKASDEVALRICEATADAQADISHAVCEVAEMLFHSARTGLVKSENIDGYSVAYSEDIPVSKRINAILEKHLAKHGLLYRGV